MRHWSVVEVPGAQGQGAPGAAGRLGVQPQQERVQFRVVARGAGVEVDLAHLRVGQGVPDRALPRGLAVGGRVLVGLDQPVVFGMSVDTAQRGDEVLGGAAAATGVAALDRVGLDLLGELLDLRRCRLEQGARTPLRADAVPVRPVGFGGAGGDGVLDLGDVLVERGYGWPVGGVGHQVGRVDVHPLQQHPRGRDQLSVRPAAGGRVCGGRRELRRHRPPTATVA